MEHSFSVQSLLEDSKRRRKNVRFLWLDLRNAFGSVPHNLIWRMLETSGVPPKFLRLCKEIYSGTFQHIRCSRDEFTSDIPLRVGIKQGCPLSPLLFVRSLGYYKSDNLEYSYVVPSLPTLEAMVHGPAPNQNLLHVHQTTNIHRIPPLVAYTDFLRCFGNNTASYHDTQGCIPIAAPNTQLTQAADFLGLVNSTNQTNGAPFLVLGHSHGWIEPTECPVLQGPVQVTTRRAIIRRWHIPQPNGNFSNLEQFLQLSSTIEEAWIVNLIRIMTTFN